MPTSTNTTMAPAFSISLPHAATVRRRACCTASSPGEPSLPSNYNDIRARTTRAIAAACVAGVNLQEVQFPPVPNMATAALNELLDANRSFTKSLLLQLRVSLPDRSPAALFPDADEVNLAMSAWREGLPAPTHALDDPPKGLDLAVSVNPGFNVSEWFALEEVDAKTLVILNADLDRVRSGYYPRIFYPRLFDAKKRFLENFTEVFYYKNLPDGGALLREFPGPWMIFYRPLPPTGQQKGRSPTPSIIWQGEERPTFKDVQAMLRKTRTEDQVLRASQR